MSAIGLMPLIGTTETDYDLRAELARKKKDGTLIRDKARMIVEELFLTEAVYVMQDPDVSHQLKLDYAKQVIEIADVKPRVNASPAGNGFTVNIVLPDPKTLTSSDPLHASHAAPLINVTPTPGTDLPDFRAAEPQASQGFRVPDFGLKLSSDLIGPPLPEKEFA